MTIRLILMTAAFMIISSYADAESDCNCGENCCYTLNDGTLTFTRKDSSKEATITTSFSNKGISNLYIENGFTSIGNNIFMDNNLTSIELPETITSIGSWAFSGNRKLSSINIPSGVKTIEGGTFYGTGFTSFVVPDTVTAIEQRLLEGASNLEYLEIGKNVTSIMSAFAWGAPRLTDLVIYDNLADADFKIYSTSPEYDSDLRTLPFVGLNSTVTILCKGNITKCAEALTKGGREDLVSNLVAFPQGCNKLLIGSGGKCAICDKEHLNKDDACIAPNECVGNFKQNEKYCNRIRYTPAEAAKVLNDDNTNEITITFKK